MNRKVVRRLAQYYIKRKGTEEVIDVVAAEEYESLLEDYDYSEEYFDIQKAS